MPDTHRSSHVKSHDRPAEDPLNVFEAVLSILKDLRNDDGNKDDIVIIQSHCQRIHRREALKNHRHQKEVSQAEGLVVHLILIGKNVGKDGKNNKHHKSREGSGFHYLTVIVFTEDRRKNIGHIAEYLLVEDKYRNDQRNDEPQIFQLDLRIIKRIEKKYDKSRMVEAQGNCGYNEEEDQLFLLYKLVGHDSHSYGDTLSESRKDHYEGGHIHKHDRLQKSVLSVLAVESGHGKHSQRCDNGKVDLRVLGNTADAPGGDPKEDVGSSLHCHVERYLGAVSEMVDVV